MAMKISIYTFVRNGLYLDYHVVPMLRHHLGLADEIIVNEGYSDDGTYEAIKDIDPRIRVIRSRWDEVEPKVSRLKYVTETRHLCTGDWCIMLDADEFIPEWEFERLRAHLAHTTYPLIQLRYTHFYGNYRVYNDASTRPFPPMYNPRVHRRGAPVEVWGDASRVRLVGHNGPDVVDPECFDVHHFGEVRRPARLRQKWHEQHRGDNLNKKRWLPKFVFDVLPHDWMDPALLPYLRLYEGQIMECVRADPDEFTRDGMLLADHLRSQPTQP
jgi:glycosyltransferase involved in cell wall biosynthesis